MNGKNVVAWIGPFLFAVWASATDPPAARPGWSPRVFTDQQSFLQAAEIEHTSNFENLPPSPLDHPLFFEQVTYATWDESRLGETSATLIRSGTSQMGSSLGNNSFPDLTLSFGRGRMVTAIGFHVIPCYQEAGDWEITLTSPAGTSFVESFSHPASLAPHYRGFHAPEGIVSVRVSRPKGKWSPNHEIDNVSRSAIVSADIAPKIAIQANLPAPVETIVRRRSGRTSSPLEPAVAAVWKDAGVGTHPQYAELFRDEARANSVAPVDMRRILAGWGRIKILRGTPEHLRFLCDDGHVVLAWQGELATALHYGQAQERFHYNLEWLGYRVVAGREPIEALGKRLGLSVSDIEDWTHTKNYHVYTRKVGETEIAVLCAFSDYTGSSRFMSGIVFQWLVTREYPRPRPTLGETLAVLPDWFPVSYLKESFFATMNTEPIRACSAGRGLTIDFAENVSKRLTDLLEGDGFEYRGEREPNRDGGVMKNWLRNADLTHATITTYPDSTRTVFTCSPPQHKGELQTSRTPPLHPSQLLPQSKRPILQFGQLSFANPKLKRQSRIFHDLAERIAADDWLVQGYKDVRNMPRPEYHARWQTADVRGSSFIRRLLPYRDLEIRLAGRISDETNDQIVGGYVSGRWVPSEGWAASVNCRLGEPFGLGPWVTVQSIDRQSIAFSLDTESPKAIRLLYNCASAEVRQDEIRSYTYTAGLPDDPGAQSSPGADAANRRRFFALYESPESLRDTVIEDLDTLRAIAREQIPRFENVTLIDWRGVDSGNPPREGIVTEHLPTERTKRELLERVLAELDSREKTLREQCEPIYNAVKTALPLHEVLDSLLEERDPKAQQK